MALNSSIIPLIGSGGWEEAMKLFNCGAWYGSILLSNKFEELTNSKKTTREAWR